MEQKRLLLILGIIVGLAFIIGLYKPTHGYQLFFLETFPAIIGIIILGLTYKRFKFTNLVYTLIAIHSIILIWGGHYSYAENPLFNFIRDYFHLARNYYDRLGHLFQGFVPALILREFLLKKSKLERGKLLIFIILSIVLAISATYELLEWGAAVTLTPGTGTAFLGTQGDVWDSQWDMFLALIGAILSLILLSKLQDKQLKRIK